MQLKRSFVLMLGSVVGLSQPMTEQLDPDYVITNWRAEEGLPESSATDMVQTSDGYLWFGTFNGLVRFDGSRFTVFGPNNVPAIPHSGVVRLFIDRRDRMWVGTLGGLVQYFEGRWQTVETPKTWTGFINDFVEAPSGLLCVKSSARHVFCSDNGRITALPHPDSVSPGNLDARLLFDAQGVLHLGVDRGLLRFRDGRWTPVPIPQGLDTGAAAPRIIWDRARDGGWLALQGDRLSKVTKEGVLRTRKLPGSFPSVGRMMDDRDGTVWMASNSEGVIRVGAEGHVRTLSKNSGLTSNSYRFVFVDRDGNHWAGSNGAGLFLLRTRIFASVGLKEGLPDFPVKSVALDANGDLLAATYGAGLQRLSQGKFSPQKGPGPIYAQALLVDRAKRIWVGSYSGGLWMSSGGPLQQQPAASTGGAVIEALFEDSKGSLWIGADQSAAVFENGAYRQVEVIEKKQPVIIDCFAEDLRTNALWAGGDGGLYRYESGQFRPVKDQAGNALPAIRAISVNDDGALWIGTADSGLLRWKNGAVTRIAMPVGFRGGIGAILRQRDYLWVATSRGVWGVGRKNLEAAAEFGSNDGAWRQLGREDGMRSFESPVGHQPSAILAPNGTILFPTLKGVAILDPSKAPAARTAEVLFEGVRFRNESGQENTVDATRGRPVQLPSEGHDVEVFYTSMSGGTPSNVLFDYELWNGRRLIASGRLEQRQLRLHRLLAGENTLRLRATNAAGVWSHVWNDLVIERQPHIWERWQAQLGTGLLVLLAVFFGVRGVLAKRAREHEAEVAHMAELQQTLLRAKENAIETARVKSEFLANMSHEIRTPLNGVLGAGKLLEMTEVNQEQRELLSTMIESGELLRRLLSDILDLSQIEAGSLVLQPAVFNFHKMIAETVRLVQPDAARKNLQLQVTVDPGIPDFVSSDETRLQQIVLNYLNNAIKFTETGAIEFSVLLLNQEEKSLTLQVRVSDTGVGIPAPKHAVVFDAFEQADSSSTRRKGGCGLGLSIVKRLAHLLGGSVGMESQLGFGSTFWANVVVTAATAPETPAASEAPSLYSAEIANLRILLAEDNRVNQMITRRMLNRLGCANIDIAENGNQVLLKADETAYDMILMDVHMPELDGIEATRALRNGHRQTPIVALTASVLDVDRVRCREAGMDDFVPKPVELSELRRVIESLLAARTR